MRTAHQVWSGVFAATFVLVAAVQCSGRDTTPTEPTVSTVLAPVASAPINPTPWSPPVPAESTTGETVAVTRVVDGDTFVVDGDRRVRVLGIDACEMSTPGGARAKDYLQTAVDNPANSPISLVREPGVDRDRYGRELRYVKLGGSDLGDYMIAYPEVGVYAGRNDASPAYVAGLRRHDDGPRNCAAAPEPAATSGGVDLDHHDDDRNHRDGAFTGGFCAHRRWC